MHCRACVPAANASSSFRRRWGMATRPRWLAFRRTPRWFSTCCSRRIHCNSLRPRLFPRKTAMKSKLLLAAGIFAAVVPASRGAAQITDPVLKRMWSIGMDSSHTWELAQTLFDSIGPRLTGTPQGTQASDWVIKMYKSWGIDAKREQYGTWRGWRRGYSHIDLVKPRVRSLEAVTLA